LTLIEQLDIAVLFRNLTLGNLNQRQALDDFVNGAFVQPVQSFDNNFVDAVIQFNSIISVFTIGL
jgi:hypothetical protein